MTGFQTDRLTEKMIRYGKKKGFLAKSVFIGTLIINNNIISLTNPCKVAVNEKNVSSLTPPDVVVF